MLAYKRAYYASHPEFAERKRQAALQRYYYVKRGALSTKTDVERAGFSFRGPPSPYTGSTRVVRTDADRLDH